MRQPDVNLTSGLDARAVLMSGATPSLHRSYPILLVRLGEGLSKSTVEFTRLKGRNAL
jgi:hypothetical protein